MKYWSIVGKEKDMLNLDKWHWAQTRKMSYGGKCWHRKIASKDKARFIMRLIRISYEALDDCEVKLGRIYLKDVPDEYVSEAAFDSGDWWPTKSKEWVECVQIRKSGKPAAIFDCIPLHHDPDHKGTTKR